MRTYQVEKTKYERFLVVRKERGKEHFIVSGEDDEKKALELIELINTRGIIELVDKRIHAKYSKRG